MKECDKCWGTGKVIDHRDLGRRVRRIRRDRGLSLKALAMELGVSSGFLSLLESGKRRWTQDLWNKATL